MERNARDSVSFAQFGWLMRTKEYCDYNCNLSLKRGLAVIANKSEKYQDYSTASAFSHFSGFNAALSQNSVYRYGIEVLSHSIESVIQPILYFIEMFKINVDSSLIDVIKENLSQLNNLIEYQKKKKSLN